MQLFPIRQTESIRGSTPNRQSATTTTTMTMLMMLIICIHFHGTHNNFIIYLYTILPSVVLRRRSTTRQINEEKRKHNINGLSIWVVSRCLFSFSFAFLAICMIDSGSNWFRFLFVERVHIGTQIDIKFMLHRHFFFSLSSSFLSSADSGESGYEA